MASEASAVIVAVRVRPFNEREDPLTCTVTVPDEKTIRVADVAALLSSAAAAVSVAVGGSHSSGANETANGISGNGRNGGSGNGGNGSGSGGSGGDGVSFGDSTTAPAKHAFAFDKVFWSIGPAVLPLHAPFLTEALATAGGGGGGSFSTSSFTASMMGVSGVHCSAAAAAAAGGGGHASVPPSRKESVLSGVSRAGSAASAHTAGGLTSSSSSPSSFSSSSSASPSSLATIPQLSQLPCLQHPPEYDDQASVYAYIGPKLYEAAMAGFNACLFAYGQTGSGKSYSMIGEHLNSAASLVKDGTVPRTSQGRELGVMPRLSADLFALMRQEREKDESVSYTVEVSFLEIYCEKVRDLLAGVAAKETAGPSTATTDAAGSLRVRQHPTRGPYVEGLSHLRVRDAQGVVRLLVSGLRDRATAGTKMNEHSSRSHAILQLHLTKVTVVSDESGVITKTRTCKVNLVDLAGSERVTQSGVTGERFEEARNINQSLSTLGRVIQQLSDKQAGKRVIPSYRDSVLTWLLSDSLGGNSKTIMLATVAPSAYCYTQTLNTLRFAGVAKKIINVATVNEDRQYQQVIAELRQQIVRLTLQLESGKAAEVHSAEIHTLKAQKEELMMENNALKSREAGVADPQVILTLRKRIAELEDTNTQLRGEKVSLQQKMLQTSSALREELAASRAEALRLHNNLTKKEAEAADWQNRYRAAQRPNIGSVSPSVIASVSGGGNDRTFANTSGASTALSNANDYAAVTSAIEARLSGQSTIVSSDPAVAAAAEQKRLQDEIAALKKQVSTLKDDLKTVKRASAEVKDSARTAQKELDDYRQLYEANQRQLDVLQERMESTSTLLESTQYELARARQSVEPAATNAQRNAEEAVALATQLAQTRQDYLKEKQGNVQLLLRVSQLEQERGQFKKQAAERRADINEVELLLLEETETSERYYLRMRYHRTISEVQKNFTGKLAFSVERGGAAAARRGSLALSLPPSSPNPCDDDTAVSPAERSPRTVGFGNDPNSPGLGASLSRSMAEQLLSQSAAATQNSWELMFAQLEYECMSDEAHQRAAIEQESLSSTVRLLAQKSRLWQTQVARTDELLVEAHEKLSATAEQLSYFRSRVTELERRMADLQVEELTSAEAAREAEAARLQLERLQEAMEDKMGEMETEANSLIEKLANAQADKDTMKERCEELERMLDDAQDALLQWQQQPTPSPTVTSRRESVFDSDIEKENGGYDTDGEAAVKRRQRQEQRANSVFDVKAVIQLKEKELLAALQDVQRMERQCEAYRNELGAANALREKESGDSQSRHAQLQQQVLLLNEKLQRLQAEKTTLAEESGTTVRDYEQRISQQQRMITMLRQSLEEESRTADENRTASQQAQVRLHSLQQDLNLAQEANDELQRQHQLVEGRYAVVQKELEDLRAHYATLEAQLLELRKNEPELYVMLERGLSEDTAAWLEKVKREKASLQKQKQDARQLNSELLAHIRSRNTHLRDVQRQLTEIAESSVNTSTAGAVAPASTVSGYSGGGGGGGEGAGLRSRRGFDSELVDVTDIQTDESLPSSIHSTPKFTPKHAL